MADITDVILNEIDRQWSQAKQCEDQRAALSNFIVVIAVATQGFIIDKGFPKRALAIAVCLALLGIFGTVASAKYYERFRLSMCRVGRLREKLDTIYANLGLDELEGRADAKHNNEYPAMRRVRLNYLWRFLMTAIALLGAFDVYVIVRYGR